MRYAFTAVLAIAGLALIIATPSTLTAGLFGPCFPCHHPCQQCHVNPCACSHRRPVVPVQPQPVSQVTTVPQVTYQDVTRTEYRTEAETRTVPVTTYRTVAVDEGHWQQVWVPRIVHKQVPQVTYQQQISYRQVPYQVTQRVPLVTYQTQTAAVSPPPAVAHSGCNVCGRPAPVVSGPPAATVPGPPVAVPGPPAAPTPQQDGQQPVILGRELQPLSSLSGSHQTAEMAASSRLAPVPDPRYLDTPTAVAPQDEASADTWTPVQTAAAPSSDSNDSIRSRDRTPPARVSSRAGRFVPAPAAADIWRTRIR